VSAGARADEVLAEDLVTLREMALEPLPQGMAEFRSERAVGRESFVMEALDFADPQAVATLQLRETCVAGVCEQLLLETEVFLGVSDQILEDRVLDGASPLATGRSSSLC